MKQLSIAVMTHLGVASLVASVAFSLDRQTPTAADPSPSAHVGAAVGAPCALPTDDDEDPKSISITGEFAYYGCDEDNQLVLFSLDGFPMAIGYDDFPWPIPPEGTVLTATGCVLHSNGEYLCKGLGPP